MNKLFFGIAFLSLIGVQFYISNTQTNIEPQQIQTDKNMEKIKEAYENWKLQYRKTQSNSPFEDQYRFEIFTQSYNKVQQNRANPNATFTLGLTKFADISDEEFAAIYLMEPETPKYTLLPENKEENYIKGKLNWKNKGAVTPVQNQAACGSCYTFATVAALEGASKLQSPYGLQKFSEQQLVSCSQPYGNEGCGGGTGDASMSYVIEHGITTEAEYPYVSGDGQVPKCAIDKGSFFISSFRNVVGRGHCTVIQKQVSEQPVYGRVNTDNWKLYTGGIFDDCNTDPNTIGHAITIVGYNTESENENERFWIVKNSWGTDWGEQGYIRLRYGNSCSICFEAFGPQF